MKDILVWGVTPDDTRIPGVDTWQEDIQHNINCVQSGRAGCTHMTMDDAQDLLVAVLAAGDVTLGDTISKGMRPLNNNRTGHTGTCHGTVRI